MSPTQPSTDPRDLVHQLEAMVLGPEYPCVGAKSVMRRDRATTRDYGELAAPGVACRLVEDLTAFAAATDPDGEFASFIATFSGQAELSEEAFEQRVWELLGAIDDCDDASWNADVSPDPDNPHFGFSVGGTAFFVVGLHPGASRMARRAPGTIVVFNLHAQFERLRSSGGYDRVRDTIRRRDLSLQGSLNPNLADHGEESEARQYSGRAVEPEWVAPFHHDRPTPE